MTPIAALFWFTLRQTFLARKVWLAVLLLASPSALVLLVRQFETNAAAPGYSWERYHASLQYTFFAVVIPLLCMLYGTALIGAEVEARTISHLLTRKLRRSTVLLVRFLAVAIALAAMTELAVLAHYACTAVGVDAAHLKGPDSRPWVPSRDLVRYLAVVPVGVAAYLAVFTVVGLAVSKPMSVSVAYLIFGELVLGNLPVGARAYTISHQIRLTLANGMPELVRLFELPSAELRERLFPSGGSGLTALGVLILVAIVVAGLLVTVRELQPTRLAQE